MKNNYENVFNVVKQIPRGRVSTYKKIAELSGLKSPRLVGNLLHKNPDPDKIPCHRVIKSDGRLASGYAFGGRDTQAQKLIKEKIEINNGRINLNKYLFLHDLLT